MYVNLYVEFANADPVGIRVRIGPRCSLYVIHVKVGKTGRSFRRDQRTRGPVLQQMAWHNKDHSLLKHRKLWTRAQIPPLLISTGYMNEILLWQGDSPVLQFYPKFRLVTSYDKQGILRTYSNLNCSMEMYGAILNQVIFTFKFER